jgi:riboflavin synthase
VFTGIVEEVGELRWLRSGHQSAELEVAAREVVADTRVGDSIMTDGVCLTVTAVLPSGFRADAQPATVRRTTLGALRPGARLNLERALAVGTRLGGHLVSGHVDGVGTVTAVTPEENALVLSIAVPEVVARLTVPQGSITVAGVSLTVVDMADMAVRVSLIPHTAAVTTLGDLRGGEQVNLEADLIGRYVAALLARGVTLGGETPNAGVTWDKLSEAGFR